MNCELNCPSSPAPLCAGQNTAPENRPPECLSLAELLDQALYTRLCRLAATILKCERPQPYWEAVDLVHEALLRIARGSTTMQFQNSKQLFALTSIIMRHILIDQARSATLYTRYSRVPLDPELPSNAGGHFDVVVIREALARLRKLESRWYQIVDMRFFSGLALEEIASHLAISERTVKRDWKAAQVWLRQQLSGTSLPPRLATTPPSSASAGHAKAILPRASGGIEPPLRHRHFSCLPIPLEALPASA